MGVVTLELLECEVLAELAEPDYQKGEEEGLPEGEEAHVAVLHHSLNGVGQNLETGHLADGC